jgi:hypothetical protein
LITILLSHGLSACADTLTSEQTKSSSTLRRDYDKTLTKAEKDAVISDLQGATKPKQQGSEAGEASEETASTGAERAKAPQ